MNQLLTVPQDERQDLPAGSYADLTLPQVCSHLATREIVVWADYGLFPANYPETLAVTFEAARLGLGMHGDESKGWPVQWWATPEDGGPKYFTWDPIRQAESRRVWNAINEETMPWVEPVQSFGWGLAVRRRVSTPGPIAPAP